ncbi:hypothetical protein CEXT_93061 [Caerostris extrusa]|uniref:Uncharacterized protein n=1 Tax=Caerostris extrusa TaxID=172846 RepID=A0AAV4QSE9_CAEEX|nr:hypothetical protein CEXT_93061 [Caerostris extrusa]
MEENLVTLSLMKLPRWQAIDAAELFISGRRGPDAGRPDDNKRCWRAEGLATDPVIKFKKRWWRPIEPIIELSADHRAEPGCHDAFYKGRDCLLIRVREFAYISGGVVALGSVRVTFQLASVFTHQLFIS